MVFLTRFLSSPKKSQCWQYWASKMVFRKFDACSENPETFVEGHNVCLCQFCLFHHFSLRSIIVQGYFHQRYRYAYTCMGFGSPVDALDIQILLLCIAIKECVVCFSRWMVSGPKTWIASRWCLWSNNLDPTWSWWSVGTLWHPPCPSLISTTSKQSNLLPKLR